jgi:hypothetical protein
LSRGFSEGSVKLAEPSIGHGAREHISSGLLISPEACRCPELDDLLCEPDWSGYAGGFSWPRRVERAGLHQDRLRRERKKSLQPPQRLPAPSTPRRYAQSFEIGCNGSYASPTDPGNAQIPIARSGNGALPTRGFLLWRFSDAGPAAKRWQASVKGRHPKTFTIADFRAWRFQRAVDAMPTPGPCSRSAE